MGYLAHVALRGDDLSRGEGEKGLVNSFFRSRAMWCGSAIPLFFGALKGLHSYDPSYPLINLSWVASYIGTQTLQLRVVFSIIGFSYLINTHISAGLWFFHLLAKAESEALALSSWDGCGSWGPNCGLPCSLSFWRCSSL